MTKLQKRALKQIQRILKQGESDIFKLSHEKDDSRLAAEFRAVSTTGTAGNNILHGFSDASDWIDDILGEK